MAKQLFKPPAAVKIKTGHFDEQTKNFTQYQGGEPLILKGDDWVPHEDWLAPGETGFTDLNRPTSFDIVLITDFVFDLVG